MNAIFICFHYEVPATNASTSGANHNAAFKNTGFSLANLLLRTLFVVLGMDTHAGKVHVDYRLISCENEGRNSNFFGTLQFDEKIAPIRFFNAVVIRNRK